MANPIGCCASQATEDAGNKWVYVKVKRKKSTFFLHIDLTETILEVKAKLEDLVQKVRPGGSVRLHTAFTIKFITQTVKTFVL